MRGKIGFFMNPNCIGNKTIGKTNKIISYSAFCSSSGGDDSGGGRGRGRGRGASGSSTLNFLASDPRNNDSIERPGVGRGHGLSNPVPSSPFLPSFNSFVAPNPSPKSGLNQGRGNSAQQLSEAGNGEGSQPMKPIFLKKDESTGITSEADSVAYIPNRPIGEKNLPQKLSTVLIGSTGRGIPVKKSIPEDRVMEENRHLNPRRVGARAIEFERRGDSSSKSNTASASVKPKLTSEEAVKKAIGVLSRDKGARNERGGDRKRRQGRTGGSDDEDREEDVDKLLGVGDDADGERLAKLLGPEKMALLNEAFEEMSYDVLPDPDEEEQIEAFDTNLKIEFETEYLMGDFETNPDMYEKPPIPLREALEKMKPFLMAYEGIENQEEWEEVMKETMERVPLLKEIVDHYCGPDRVTAKEQHGELKRVAKTLPASAPNSMKNFTDRAVLSLQSNPGWGFHRKWQYMDKLVAEVSKSCK
ncbi:unnamed protein product [Amaranthus hypochondriacus]